MGGYKEHKIFDILKRKSIIIRYIFLIVLIFCITIMFLIQINKKDETRNIIYTENSDLDYKVYLKDNDFFEEEYLEKDNQYIANLIDYIEAEFEYELESSDKNIDYLYTYRVIAEVNVEDKSNNNSLYEFSEELVEETQNKANTNSKLVINEQIKIDYNKYNDIINEFINTYDLDNSVSTLTISMYVNITDDLNQSNKINQTPVVSLNIPLTRKTIEIDIESNLVNENDINVCKTINNEKFLLGGIVLFFIDICLVVKLIIFIKDTKNEKAIYNMRLKKIMSNYGSYVQKVKNELKFDGYQILEIKSFEDLLQVREVINKPIFMVEKSLAMETYFFISSENYVYIYELKAGKIKKTNKKEDIENEDEITIG